MIVGLGIDLVEVARIRRILAEHGERFLRRVFTPEEVRFCSAQADPAVPFAARVAAKEAAMKALGTGWGRGVAWRDIETVRPPEGPPRLALSGQAARAAKELGATRFHLSISHTETYAVAAVILES